MNRVNIAVCKAISHLSTLIILSLLLLSCMKEHSSENVIANNEEVNKITNDIIEKIKGNDDSIKVAGDLKKVKEITEKEKQENEIEHNCFICQEEVSLVKVCDNCKKAYSCKDCISNWAKTKKSSMEKVNCPACKTDISSKFTKGSKIVNLLNSFIEYAKNIDSTITLTQEFLELIVPFLTLYENRGFDHNPYYQSLIDLGFDKLQILHKNLDLNLNSNISYLYGKFEFRLINSFASNTIDSIKLLLSHYEKYEFYALEETFVRKFGEIPFELASKIFNFFPRKLEQPYISFFSEYDYFKYIKNTNCKKCSIRDGAKCKRCEEKNQTWDFVLDNVETLYNLHYLLYEYGKIGRFNQLIFLRKKEFISLLEKALEIDFEKKEVKHGFIFKLFYECLSDFTNFSTDCKGMTNKELELVWDNLLFLSKQDTSYLQKFYKKLFCGDYFSNIRQNFSNRCSDNNVKSILQLTNSQFNKLLSENIGQEEEMNNDISGLGEKKVKIE